MACIYNFKSLYRQTGSAINFGAIPQLGALNPIPLFAPKRPLGIKNRSGIFGGVHVGGDFCKLIFASLLPVHIWHWNQFCLVASQQWLGGCKARAGNRSIDSGFWPAWNGWGVIDSWKWHLLIALIQSCFTANWVWIWDLDSVSDLRWHVCKLLSTAGLWRLAVKLKVFLTYSSFRKSNSGVSCFN